MDIVGSIICIVIFSPVMLLSAILVKITSSGPLIFKQERVGLHNEKFMMYKFRTMYVQTEEEETMLGVCLGHQAIGEAFGAKLTNLSEVYHGVATPCTQFGNDVIFDGLDKRIEIGRYHSWVVDRSGFPDCLDVTAVSDDGCIMGLKHKNYDIHGIQFHPESYISDCGSGIIRNWLKMVR